MNATLSTASEDAPLTGNGCTGAALPTWRYEAAGHRVILSVGDYTVRLPLGWSAKLERPGLVVISPADRVAGVLPVFELFVGQICKVYDMPRVQDRIAKRAMAGLMPPDKIAATVAAGGKQAGLGGPVGQSIILNGVDFATDRGERTASIWVTDLAETSAFGMHAAAFCPTQKGQRELSSCEKTYVEMLESAK